jgi:hypothetical protein
MTFIRDDTSSGVHVLHDAAQNKGTAFTEEDRDRLGLPGLLPRWPTTAA